MPKDGGEELGRFEAEQRLMALSQEYLEDWRGNRGERGLQGWREFCVWCAEQIDKLRGQKIG